MQCGITPYHLLEQLTLRRDGQKEVRYVQTAAALFVGGQTLQHIGYNRPFADVGQQGGFLPPSLRCPQIGNESYLPVPKNGHRLPVEAAILPARCQPDVIRHEVAHDNGGLLALDQHHRCRGGAVQQVFAEETLPEMAEYVRQHPLINNILISGGDSFLNSNEIIRRYLDVFTEIPSLQFIRFGTRTPVTFPQRITEDDGELLSILSEYSRKKQIIVVTQFNHPREITPESRKAVDELRAAGCTIRNQTVLLKGVNDEPAVLALLMNKLVSTGVAPYYVFQCRPVEGVQNQFQVPILRGSRIVDLAKAGMSGPAKAFRYAMSHPTGKIEILGQYGDRMLFKYHQAKYDKDQARIFTRAVSDTECWFDDPDDV